MEVALAKFHTEGFKQCRYIFKFSIRQLATGDLESYGRKRQNKITLRNLLDPGPGRLLGIGSKVLSTASLAENINIQSASFLHRELPIRCAHRAIELDSTPIFQQSKHIQQVSNWYKQSFQELLEAPAPTDINKEKAFSKLVENIYERHSATLITMAKGAHEIKSMLKKSTAEFSEYDDIQYRLDDFYLSRIGIRILKGQYLALRSTPATPDMIGLISLKCSVYSIAKEAIDDATYMCKRVHGEAPAVIIAGHSYIFEHTLVLL